MATVEQLQTWIAEAEARRHEVALGEAVIDTWRDGRRVRRAFTSVAELDSYILELRRELSEAQAAASGMSRRRPINLAWSN